MTQSNRTMNRLILILLGLIAIAAGLLLGSGSVPAARAALKRTVSLPTHLTIAAATDWTIAVGAGVIVILSLIWIVTRGRGGTSIAARRAFGRDAVTINIALIRAVIDDALRGAPDIVSTGVDAYRVRRQRVLRMRVAVRRGGNAVAALEMVDEALSELDRTLGQQVPVLVHLTRSTTSALARPIRVR
ncbi:hypothetical protein [Curtobacterium ammoniigenes]|uniref:hypothetical protein n=1 Tax=Curtobacterium ammoniigenes TaxID=395387 RepID=UPI0008329123|nr:hypothetical protein [Curtobacterium ammoniigenes]